MQKPMKNFKIFIITVLKRSSPWMHRLQKHICIIINILYYKPYPPVSLPQLEEYIYMYIIYTDVKGK